MLQGCGKSYGESGNIILKDLIEKQRPISITVKRKKRKSNDTGIVNLKKKRRYDSIIWEYKTPENQKIYNTDLYTLIDRIKSKGYPLIIKNKPLLQNNLRGTDYSIYGIIELMEEDD